MNSLLQGAIHGLNLKDVNSILPSGIIEVKEGYLRSIPLPSAKDCYISGRFDIVSRLDDGTYAVVDFKITDPTADKIQKFTNQLHAYKFALENPANGIPARKVSKMGVISINPESVEFPEDKIIFKAVPQWFPIAENMGKFFDFIAEVSRLLNGPVPKTSDSCKWCRYRICFPKDTKTEDIPF